MENSFVEILREHRDRYPLMEPQDYGKLIFQSVFGPEHMVVNRQAVWEYMAEEFSGMTKDVLPQEAEDIGSGLCRFPLCACPSMEAAELLTDLFVLTAKEKAKEAEERGDKAGKESQKIGKKGSVFGKEKTNRKENSSEDKKDRLLEELQDKLELVKALDIPGMEAWARQWQEKGYPAVHHSKAYNEAYHPHYRLLRKEYTVYFPVLWEIYQLVTENKEDQSLEQKVLSDRKLETVSGPVQGIPSGSTQEMASGSAQGMESGQKQEGVQVQKQLQREKPVIIGIDGRCGSGKTSFARLVAEIFPCNIIHTDDFYLPMEERVENWTEKPGGNMDFHRLRSEILIPAQSGEKVLYRPYHCQEGGYGEALQLAPCELLVVEGSYSHHPLLAEAYDLKIFLTCAKEVQAKRLREREGSYFDMFEKRWIPMEENYFYQFDVEAGSDLVVETDSVV